MNMICPNCKKEIENGSAFCEHCGACIKKSKKGLWIMLSVIFIAAVVTIVVITVQEQIAMERYRVEQRQLELEQQLQAERKAREEAERKAEAERQAELVRQEAERKTKEAESRNYKAPTGYIKITRRYD
jgi:predicted Holliday junction resolvase-like endonuclease